ncbi:hypothetical protein ACLIIZ_03660 [Azonexus caeni]|jgi:outer membrane protein assembly factor BamE (lipoprotein component of BamABCDE complex)|uniref:hypothetical protein n=1 Tax=Azonexus caeni TaxID=266126 RepID=UPI003A8A5493
MIRTTLLISCLALLAACAGTPFKWSEARQIRAGMTTAEVTALVGPPTRVDAQGDVVRYVWVFVNGLTYSTRSLRVDFQNGRATQAPPIPDEFQD